jgi:hypothetical protein
MQTGLNSVFGTLPAAVVKDWNIPKELWRWRARNSDIQQWTITQSDEVLLYLEDADYFSALPDKIRSYLKKHRNDLEKRAAFQRGDCEWWKYTWPLHKDHYRKSKILCPYLAQSNRFALEESGRVIGLTDTTVIFDSGQAEELPYFLGILNSNVLTWRFSLIGKLKSNGIREYFWNSISKLPIPRPNFADSKQKKQHDLLVAEVLKMIELTKGRDESSTQQLAAIDRATIRTKAAIEDIVTDIFGLTATERNYIDSALSLT